MLLAVQMRKCTQIMRFSLKIIQYPNVSEICALKLISVLSKLNNLQNFDIYLRRLVFTWRLAFLTMDRLSIETDQIIELAKEIQQMENVKCLRYNQSLHVFK